MPFCPNPECGHRKLVGEPAEYRAGVERCADCGAELTQEPSAPETRARRERVPCPRHLRRRLWLTLAIVGGLLAIAVAPSLLAFTGVLELFDIYGGGPAELVGSVLQIGIQPFVFGFIAVEIVALIVPRLRRRRLTDQGLRGNLRVAALITGGAVALFQGYGIGSYAESALFWDPHGFDGMSVFPLGPGLAFRMIVSLIAAGGASLWVLAAAMVDRYGVGRGFAVVLLAQFALEAPFLLESAAMLWWQGQIAALDILITAAIAVVAMLAFHYGFRYGDRLAGDRPFTLPTCGTAPYEAGLVPLAIGGLAVSYLYVDPLGEALALFTPGSAIYFGALAGGAVLLALPCSALFNWRRRRDLARGASRAAWLKARLLSGAFLVALAGADFLAARWLGPSVAVFFPGLFALLLAYAFVADWLVEVRARWRAGGGAELGPLEVHQDVADALEAARRLTDDAGQRDVVLTGLRFRSLSYFFGPYVPLIVIGRRTGDPSD